MTMFLFFEKRLRALSSDGGRFSGGSRSLEKFWYEVTAMCSSQLNPKFRKQIKVTLL